MTKKERVIAVLRGELPDYTPSGFWLHFPPEDQKWETAMEAHLKFMKDTDTDICKVMNEALLRGSSQIRNPEDFQSLKITNQTMENLEQETRLVRRIAEKIGDEAAVLVTVHGALVSCHHASGRDGFFVDNLDFFRRCMREAPEALQTALEQTAEVLCAFVKKCKEAGADGIYYALLGAEKDLFTPEEYHTYIEPFDRRILETANDGRGFNVLHICKKNLDISRFRDYPADVVNWGVYEGNPSLEEGMKIFADKVVLGGMDNKGVLVNGTKQEIQQEVCRLLSGTDRKRFILGADCTLPTDIDRSRIRSVVEASRSFR